MSQLAVVWAQALIGARPLVGLLGLPRYLRDWRRFGRASGQSLSLVDSYPCLTDWQSHTPFDAHYFYQAAWLARRLRAAGPGRHVDIGSDIRMINVLSAFVPTEFVDYRPLSAELKGLECSAGDLTGLAREDASIPSLSCLHVVEHVGLGRYGDPVDPEGSRKALAELQRVVAPGGWLYLSVPVGRERVCFNAHRVFDPETIVSALSDLTLREFSLVDDRCAYRQYLDLADGKSQEYGCGLFVFEKP